MHYWYGCIDTPFKEYRDHLPRFRFITDTIQLKRDLGNMIPDKSWMLYLLEVFNIQKRAVELNLICQFDGQDYFEAHQLSIPCTSQMEIDDVLKVIEIIRSGW